MPNFGKLLKSFQLADALIQFSPKVKEYKFPTIQQAKDSTANFISNVNRSIFDRASLAEEKTGADAVDGIRPAPVFGSNILTRNFFSRVLHPTLDIAESQFSPTARQLNNRAFIQTTYTLNNMQGIPDMPSIEANIDLDNEILSAEIVKLRQDFYTKLSLRRANQKLDRLTNFGYLKRKAIDFAKQGTTDGSEVFPDSLNGKEWVEHADRILTDGFGPEMVVKEDDFLTLVNRATYLTNEQIDAIPEPEIKELAKKFRKQYRFLFEELSKRGLIFDPRKASDEEIASFLTDEMQIEIRDQEHLDELIKQERANGWEKINRYVPRSYLHEAVRRGRGTLRNNLYEEWWPNKEGNIKTDADQFTVRKKC